MKGQRLAHLVGGGGLVDGGAHGGRSFVVGGLGGERAFVDVARCELVLEVECWCFFVGEEVAVDGEGEGGAVVPRARESCRRLAPLAICREAKVWRKAWK